MASKLPLGMLTLSLLFLVGRDHAYGTAGLAVSSLALGQGLTAPLRGRLVDRHGPRAVLLGCLVGHLTAMAALTTTADAGGSAGVPMALAAALGATTPPVGVMMRTVWHARTDGDTLATAMALDSAMTGAALITGPVVASWLSLSLSAAAPFVVLAVVSTGVVVLLLNVPTDALPPPRSGQSPRSRRTLFGPLASAPLRRLLVVDGLFVTAVTALDVALPIYAKEHRAASFAGLYLAAQSLGSVLGSLALGAVPRLADGGRRLPLLLGVFASGACALVVAGRFSPVVVLLVGPVAGLAIGCTFGVLRTLGGDLAPEGQVVETVSWLATLDTAGAAVGAATVTQVIAARGSGTALLLAPVVALSAVVAAVGWSSRAATVGRRAPQHGDGAGRREGAGRQA
ncbi:MFS transporter [Streptomyces sp. NPDC005562]|uniref:MFS transporter n=1 Tax=Streptomyces sp. NPDC005562 TaxID=3154890 RepID=UPI0033B0A4FE